MMTTEYSPSSCCRRCGTRHEPGVRHVEGLDCPYPFQDHPIDLTPMFNGNGFEAAEPDEAESSTVFRLICESPVVQAMSDEDRQAFWLNILSYVTDELIRSHH